MRRYLRNTRWLHNPVTWVFHFLKRPRSRRPGTAAACRALPLNEGFQAVTYEVVLEVLGGAMLLVLVAGGILYEFARGVIDQA